MDFHPLFDWCFNFYAQYPIFCYVLVGALLLLILWKPAKVIKTALLILVLIVILYVCINIVNSMMGGMQIKDKAIHRTEKAIE